VKQKILWWLPPLLLIFVLGGNFHIWRTRGGSGPIRTLTVSGLTFEERCADESGQIVPCRPALDVRPGDILVTASAHTLFFRHGHVGVYAGDGLVLEVLGLGSVSEFLPLKNWTYFPTLQILRLPLPDGIDIKKEAQAFIGLPYGPFARRSERRHVHCGTLVWQLFDHLGVDAVPDGWVLPLNFRGEIIYDGF